MNVLTLKQEAEGRKFENWHPEVVNTICEADQSFTDLFI